MLMKGRRILFFICTAVFIYSLINIFNYYYEGYKNKKTYQELGNLFHTQENTQEPQKMKSAESKDEDTTSNNDSLTLRERFEPLLKINPEVVGWITLPGTVIDYPVVRTDDNEYYLSHDIYGNESKRGAIFMDCGNSPNADNRNTILYGHNMRDGSMFKDLTRYKNEDFFEENTTLWFYTLKEITQWEIFSAYVTKSEFNYIKKDFISDEDYLSFITALKDKSMHQTEIELNAEDRIITLSTCSYEVDDARFVVHARRIK